MIQHLDAQNKSIGIFDSGIGGLTVANAIQNVLPNEHLIYFGDTAHLPYGDKSADAIRFYALKISKFLLEQQCKMIVIACNSASSAAYNTLLEFFDGNVLFVNVVDPLVSAVVDRGYSEIGVIATKATIRSNIYRDKIKHKLQSSKVHSLATPLLAPMIEEGFFRGEISQSVIETYLGQDQFKSIDALLLACTHYPLIKKEIQEFFNHKVQVLDSTDVVANFVKNMLEKEGLLSNGKEKENEFYVSDYTSSFEDTAKMFYGKSIELNTINIW
ncbi:MAG: glutamate racemase [Saprospiraceae bacterium]|nr:glutamate racemase [Saprospiraceae bacterium]